MMERIRTQTLPLELACMIFDHLHDDWATLLTVGAVCRGWHHLVEQYLPHGRGMGIELRVQREVARLSSLARNRILGAREVHIQGDATHSGSLAHLGTFAAMLSGYLHRLEVLHISNGVLKTRHIDAPRLFSCLSTFTTIRGLHLVDVTLPSTTMFANVVSALTHLRYVTCYGVSVDKQDNHAALPNPTPPSEGRAGEKPYPRRELRLDCRTDMEAALSSLAAAGFTPEVHKITVDLKGSPARLEAFTTELHRLHQLGHLCLTDNLWKVEDERKLFQGLFTSAVVRLDLIHVTLPSPTFLAGVLCALVQLHTVTFRDVRFASTTSQQNSHESRSSSPSRQGKLENLFRVLDLHVAPGTGPGGFAPANLPLPDCCNVRLVGSLPVHRLKTLAEMLSKYGGRHGSSCISDAVWGAGRVTPIGGELNPMTVDRWVSLMPAMGTIRNLHLHNVKLPSSGMFVRIIRNLPQHVPPVASERALDRVSPVGRHPTQAWFLDLDCLDMYDILACVTTTPSWRFRQQLVSFGLGIHAAPVSGFGGFRYRDYARFGVNLESITHLGFVIYDDLPLDQLAAYLFLAVYHSKRLRRLTIRVAPCVDTASDFTVMYGILYSVAHDATGSAVFPFYSEFAPERHDRTGWNTRESGCSWTLDVSVSKADDMASSEEGGGLEEVLDIVFHNPEPETSLWSEPRESTSTFRIPTWVALVPGFSMDAWMERARRRPIFSFNPYHYSTNCHPKS